MFDLPPAILALAFIVVGAVAFYLGRRTGAARTVRLPRDYYIGLDHLINDRFDRAAEVFARMAQVEGDATEIQFALGSLFRRRGEVERAIAIHTRLRDSGGPAVREKAAFALALDYASAGLMDRAEGLFLELAASREHRREALDQLVRIYEQQGEWDNALKVFRELPQQVQQERRRVAAHYFCELAEHALLQGDGERAASLLRQARSQDGDLSRIRLLTARLSELTGDHQGAVALYLDALERAPGLALEIIPRLLAIARQNGDESLPQEVGTRLKRTGRVTPRQIAWLLATALPEEDLRQLSPIADELGEESAAATREPAFSALLTRISDAGGRYQCNECGLHSVGWYWRCPKCRSWDSLHPAVFKWAERT